MLKSLCNEEGALETVTSALIVKALDGLAMRQAYTAQNIANGNTPAYQPVSVRFEAALRAAASKGIDAIRQVEPEVSIVKGTGSSDGLRLDLELATASQTAMRYGALIELLDRQMMLSRTAITGGQ